MSTTSATTHDTLLQYCTALDAGNIDAAKSILERAETDDELYEEIVELHDCFDSNESFTAQLQHMRGEVRQ